MVAERTLTEQEMVEILEDLARHSESATARIHAMKMLREMDAGGASADDGFAALDELAPRRVKNRA